MGILDIQTTIVGRLSAVPNWSVYVGEPPNDIPLDSRGYVKTYVCLYMAPDRIDPNYEDLTEGQGLRGLTFQLTVVSGYPQNVLRAAEKADQAIMGAGLTASSSRAHRDPTGTVQADRDTLPLRWYLPLIYRVDLGD